MRQSYGEVILEQERLEKQKRIKIMMILGLIVLGIAVGTAAIMLFLNKDKIQSVIGKDEIEMSTESTEIPVSTESELLAQLAMAKEEGTEELLALMKQELITGESAVEVFRHIYKDDLVLISGGRYHFSPIQDTLKKNSYKTENLKV